MTKFEKMTTTECHDPHEDDPAFAEFEYDPREGHYHVDPPPPESLGEPSYDDGEMFVTLEKEWTVDDLKDIRAWLDAVLVEFEP